MIQCYVTMGGAWLAVNAQNAVCGVVLPLDDKSIIPNHQRATNDSRAFQRHMLKSGQPRPIEDYFLCVKSKEISG